jgi:hypothetical protein
MTLPKWVARMIPAQSSKPERSDYTWSYWIKLVTRCGCTQENSLGTTPPTRIAPIWQVALLRPTPTISLSKDQVVETDPLEIRVFDYTRMTVEVEPAKVTYVYHERSDK